MNTHPMKLITIVCEAYALEPVKKVLREVGAHGWTHFTVEGAGAGGERTGEMKEFANVQIEVVLQPAAAQALLARLEGELFPRYGMIAFESDVRVMRSGKF
jgi:nitrogen regulatory protein PII